MATSDDVEGERAAADESAERETTIDEIAGIIAGSGMAGGTGEVGDAAPGPQYAGTAGGVAIGGMAARNLVEEEAAQPADADADSAPGTLAGSGASDVGDSPADRDTPGRSKTLIAAQDAEEAAEGEIAP